MATLHITNGDAAADGLRRARLGGEVLPWRDVLHDGPVPPDDDPAAFRDARARFIAERGWGDFGDVVRSMEERDSLLDSTTGSDQVVLWFEPDLYDQLQLAQVLSRLAGRLPAARPQLDIVPADFLLGALEPSRFVPLFESRRGLSDADLLLGREAWQAITAADPVLLPGVAQAATRSAGSRSFAGDDQVRLPHLAGAVSRWLEELPAVGNGLSRSERQICEVLENGVRSLAYTFERAHASVESWPWLGDWSFAWYVGRMASGDHPLIALDGPPVAAQQFAPRGISALFARGARLTAFGHDVLRSREDLVSANGIDRWFGGVHLRTGAHWRWDAGTNRVVPVRA